MPNTRRNISNITSFPRVVTTPKRVKRKRRKVAPKILTQPAPIDVFVGVVKSSLATSGRFLHFVHGRALHFWRHFSLSHEQERVKGWIHKAFHSSQIFGSSTENLIKKAPQWWNEMAPAVLTSTMMLWCGLVGVWFFWKAFWGIFGMTNLPFSGISWSEMLHAVTVLFAPPLLLLCGAHWYESKGKSDNNKKNSSR